MCLKACKYKKIKIPTLILESNFNIFFYSKKQPQLLNYQTLGDQGVSLALKSLENFLLNTNK
jgi:hypothetical protein